MGAAASRAGEPGKALVARCALRFTAYLAADVDRMLARHREAGAPFALDRAMFEAVTGIPALDARACFELLDTDDNGLLDAFETLATVCAISSLDDPTKIAVLYAVFDFGGRGALAIDEVVMLLHSTASGVHKLEPRAPLYSLAEVETFVKRNYLRYGKTVDDEVSLEDMQLFCQCEPVRRLLHFTHTAARLAPLPDFDGANWVDPELADVPTALYADPDASDGPLGAPGLFSWRHAAPTARAIVPDGAAPSRVCSGYGSASVGTALSLIASRPKALARLFVTTGQEPQRWTLQLFVRGDWDLFNVDTRLLVSEAGFCAGCGRFDPPSAFCHAESDVEIWPQLVEKALAKACGSYASLARLATVDVLEMLTGGAAHVVRLPSAPPKCFQALKQALVSGVAGLVHEPAQDPRLAAAVRRRRGIAPGRTYVVQAVKTGWIQLLPPLAPPGVHSYQALEPSGGSGEPQDSDDDRGPQAPVPDQPDALELLDDTAPAAIANAAIASAVARATAARESTSPRPPSSLSPPPPPPPPSPRELPGAFWMPFDDARRIFTDLRWCRVFEPELWDTHARRIEPGEDEPAALSGGLSGAKWFHNPQLCLHVLDNSARLALSCFQAALEEDQAAGGLQLAVARHDFGDAVDGEAVPLTVLLRDTLVAVAPRDQGRCSSHLEVSLPPGKYAILVLGHAPLPLVLLARGFTGHAGACRVLLLGGQADVDWQDRELVRSAALAACGAERLTTAEVQQAQGELREAAKAAPAAARCQLLLHLQALAAARLDRA